MNAGTVVCTYPYTCEDVCSRVRLRTHVRTSARVRKAGRGGQRGAERCNVDQMLSLFCETFLVFVPGAS